MDAYAHRLANALAGNHPSAATLEITLVGPELEFDEDRLVAVTGADFDMMLDGDPRLMQTAFMATRGSRLTVGRRLRGARAYLAVEGGIEVEVVHLCEPTEAIGVDVYERRAVPERGVNPGDDEGR